MKIWTPILVRKMRNFSSQAEEMEQAISKFQDGMPALESNGYQQLHRHLAKLPVPDKQKISSMTHAEAVEGGLIKTMREEEPKRFTPPEVLLYKHAVEYRYKAIHTSTYRYTLVHTSTYQYILVCISTYNHIQVHTCTY